MLNMSGFPTYKHVDPAFIPLFTIRLIISSPSLTDNQYHTSLSSIIIRRGRESFAVRMVENVDLMAM